MEWGVFLREMLGSIGEENCVFTLSDSQIVSESFLEDLNNLLNIGEIPNLFTLEEKENLFDELWE